MPDYTQYKREDFLADESFSNYLLQKNEDDIQFWQKWISDNAQHSTEIKEARLMFFLIRDQKDLAGIAGQAELDKEYYKFKSLVSEHIVIPAEPLNLFPKEKTISKKPFYRRIIWQAASAAAVLILAFSAWLYFGSNNGDKPGFVLFAKTNDAIKNVSLPDGSIIQLNNNSSIEIAKGYNKNKRQVLLKGSAFFQVYKDHSKPFIVTTGSITTTALGTTFYIYNLHPGSISISLVEGRVRVEGDKNYVELLPGEKAFYNSGEAIFKDTFNKDQLISFTNGKIQFEHANLAEIKTVLAEYFNRQILIVGNAPKINFTGNFDSKKIETILEALQFTYNITYKSEGQKVIISFKPKLRK